MSEPLTLTLISFVITLGSRVIARIVTASRIEEAARQVLRELDLNDAYNPFTAVDLHLDPRRRVRLVYRNFRPRAVDILTRDGVLKKTGTGKFYLRKRLDGRVLRCTEETCQPVY
jgi:hypothetical protein